MRRFLVIALLSSTLTAAVPRDGSWLDRIQSFLHHAFHSFHGITSTGDGITQPKP